MAKIVLETAGTALLTANELRTHLRIDDPIEDAYLETIITTVQQQLEEVHWTQFTTATYDQYFDAWTDPLVLSRPPLGSITTVKYTDNDGTLQTVADTVYEAGEVLGVGTVRRKFNQNWPTDKRAHEDTIVVRFTCGHGVASAVPAAIKHAVKLMCGHLYWHREPTEQDRMTINLLMGPYTYKTLRRC